MQRKLISSLVLIAASISLLFSNNVLAKESKNTGEANTILTAEGLEEKITDKEVKKIDENIHYNKNGKAEYKEELFENTYILSSDKENGALVNTFESEIVVKYSLCNSAGYMNEEPESAFLNHGGSYKALASLLGINMYRSALVNEENAWDDTVGVYAYSKINYTKQYSNSQWNYKLTSASGYWTVDSGYQIKNKKVLAANKDGWSSPSDVTKLPSGNSFSYTYSFSNYVGSNAMDTGVCGIIQYCKVTRGTSQWDFYLPNVIVDNASFFGDLITSGF